ncbi:MULTISPECIES: phosphoadenosine phosphosulfate reductase family protein [Cellulophaga]|uniref:Phosphoadenosine phosphosulfate reductase n=2 Tax=Cellulophaga TaxID=104264 RepID=F0RD90_CELLC|nr:MULTISPECIES: phosphoadenosine phosphosulfate reductase family protein [Cellulophaga]ADY29791.1 phosphoadenosine phosphosulfate reductase [Cellulophaga lytica DSM 7489]AIM60790.1 phosphoadenylylsulfate reductase [Cellulophaga lytica]APU10664.1 phosphoadenylylsulfate reductase [Cellulophaga lytica]EWH15161.1 phosphoadenosine phosphosulfate reductase [Cellulophaga geojensis KL-A]MDO6490379.1 phosphoadenosine phosphosulfate reductase family protein [Cellulophaga sp. 2_MG-2023]
MSFTEDIIKNLNAQFRGIPPEEIISWAVEYAKNAVITTNFRPYEVAILNAVTAIKKDIPVIWCDTGYNTPNTYKHAEELISTLDLNVKLYVPLQTSAHRDAVMGIPSIEDPKHKEFTEQVKLEPFKRAMAEHKPDVWFTNLRKGQTALRDSLGILSLSKDGILKVSPFYHWSDVQLDAYLAERNLPNEHKYFDPTKVLENRECGLHT